MIQPGSLVKFCKPEHNILDRCHTIRFGTLEYYREMDPSFAIADAEEGRESTDIHSVSSTNASPEVREMFPILERGGTHIEFSKMITTVPNCYIWCCSIASEDSLEKQGTKFDSAYTSCYPITDRFRLAECLFQLLSNSITINAFSDSAKNLIHGFSVRKLTELSFGCFHQRVYYVDKKLSQIRQGHLTHYIEQIPSFLRPIFVKTEKYAKENEYRFVFWVEHKQQVLAVRKDPVDIPILPIASI